MPHVTLIHGISNKPPPEDLIRIWREALANAREPLPLGDLGVTSSLVYWADLLYERPDEDLSAYEGVLENTPQAGDAGGNAPVRRARGAGGGRLLAGLRRRVTACSDADIDAGPPPVAAAPQGALERVPLPWALKKPLLSAFLRDVHHYLFDVDYAPPGRAPVPIQHTIRQRFVAALAA